MWKLWILTSSTRHRLVASRIRLSLSFFAKAQNMHMQGSTNHIDCLGFRNFFNDGARGAFKQHTMQKLGNRIQTRETPINPFYTALWFHIYTGWFERRGCSRTQFFSPLVAILFRGGTALGGHNTNKSGCLTKPFFRLSHAKKG